MHCEGGGGGGGVDWYFSIPYHHLSDVKISPHNAAIARVGKNSFGTERNPVGAYFLVSRTSLECSVKASSY